MTSAAEPRRSCCAKGFFEGLVAHLRQVQLSRDIDSEPALKTAIAAIVREHVARELDSSTEVYVAVDRKVATKQDQDRWTESKPLQNVTVFGSPNSTDIFICDDSTGAGGPPESGVSIELEFAKVRGPRTATTLPNLLHHALGQCLIASLRHRVICLIVCERFPALRSATEVHRVDRREALVELVGTLRSHPVALIVRGLDEQ